MVRPAGAGLGGVHACSPLEALELDADLTQVIATICLTVLLSVLAHGLSADPLAKRYGAWAQRTRPEQELVGSTEPRSRRSLRQVRGAAAAEPSVGAGTAGTDAAPPA